VKYFAWDNAKNATLRPQCILFEDIVFHIERGHVVDVLRPAADLYAGQRIFVIQCGDRLYLVPFVEDEYTVFLKTIIPSRKATTHYLREGSDYEA
jgi:hypothetical protein